MTRSLLLAISTLLAALPPIFANHPLQAISINTGPVVAAGVTPTAVNGVAPLGTGNARAGTTFSVNVAAGANATGIGAPRPSGSAGSQNVWVIKVGSTNGSLAFSPNTVTGAQVGDQVQFQFYPRNHSVAMGDYANPCQPMQNSQNAFFSGFMPTTADGQMTFTVPVTSTEPMWMYCSQGRHCQEGMVAVVNPPATGQTLQDYQQRAVQAQQNVSPVEAVGGAPSASGTGQIGGQQPGAIPSGPTTAAPAPAQQTNPNGASTNIRKTSWSLLALAAFAILVL